MTHQFYLIPGFFGFANLGELKYFEHVRNFLLATCGARGARAEVVVVRTFPTGSLERRAARLLETIATQSRGAAIHLIGHSSGGLDARLAVTPGAELPTKVRVDARRFRSVITVATPHHGTPLAAAFTGLLGQQLLRLLSLATMYMLRFGGVPVSVMLEMGSLFATLNGPAAKHTLIDELFARLLADFSIGRQRAVRGLFKEVAKDQALLLQLTPEAMTLFNALARDRPGVRYGCVITRSRRPNVTSMLRAGFDASAQTTHAIYQGLYRLAAQAGRRQPTIARAQQKKLKHAFERVDPRSNDGVVPTYSQLWGDLIAAGDADHLDIIGHFAGASHVPPHIDWLTSGSGFDRKQFERTWTRVVKFALRP